MTMLRGYTIPQPGAGDGEYGSFGSYRGCSGCESAQMSGLSASPAAVPYWDTNIMRPIPALNGFNGFGFATEEDTLTMGVAGDLGQAPSDAMGKLGLVLAGAAAGYFFGRNPIAAMLGAAAGLAVGKVAKPSFGAYGFDTSIRRSSVPLVNIAAADPSMRPPSIVPATNERNLDVRALPPPSTGTTPTLMTDPATAGGMADQYGPPGYVPPGTPVGVAPSSGIGAKVAVGVVAALAIRKFLL